jgi:hypothetical protein
VIEKLWVLQYGEGRTRVYFSETGATRSLTAALKFTSKMEAKDYQSKRTKLWPYEVASYEFEFKENEA